MSIWFNYHLELDWPPLAWVLRRSRNSESIDVFHGPGVETRDTFFWEGAWRGSFAQGDFHESDLVLGSGARLSGSRLIICTPSHPLERLHSFRAEGHLTASNSLALLMAFEGLRCETEYPDYDIDMMAFLDGLPSAVSLIPLEAGHRVGLHYCSNLYLDPALDLQEHPKPAIEVRPRTYGDYLSFLQSSTAQLMRNASAGNRDIRYEPLATVSSGYDSPACAVLAREVGCRRAVTFSASRSDFGSDSDSGGRIGELLDLRTEEFDRDQYLGRTDYPEVEFLGVGTGGEDVVMSSLEPALPDTVLFTGFLGDTVWGLSSRTEGSRQYRMTYPAGASLQEFRIRVGFIHFPVPQSHQRLHPWVQRISVSPEMAPWRLGGDYDRPIPRRIAEEAGVPREWFGSSKKAITQPFYQGDDLRKILSPASLESFRQFCERNDLPPRGPATTPWQPKSALARLGWRASWRLPSHRVRIWKFLRTLELTESPFTFQWAVARLRQRYVADS
jgi:hypothetical protein